MVERLLQERCGRQLSACVRMNTRLAGVEFELNCGKKQSSKRPTADRRDHRGRGPGVSDRDDIDLDLDLKYHLQTCTCTCNHMGFGNYMDYYQVSSNSALPQNADHYCVSHIQRITIISSRHIANLFGNYFSPVHRDN